MNAHPIVCTLRQRLIVAIAVLLVWGLLGFEAPLAIAQAAPTPSTSHPVSTGQPDTTVSPSLPQRPSQGPATETTTPESSPTSVQPSVQPSTRQTGQEKTYAQPPHPYNMEAIEAYDKALYGAGR